MEKTASTTEKINSQEPKNQAILWHSMTLADVFGAIGATDKGLNKDQVHQRQQQFGPNALVQAQGRSALMRFLSQFDDVLIYVLIAAGLMTALLQHWIDAGVIFAVVVVNAIIGFIQEGKAENALKAIRQMLSASAIVLRQGQQITIKASALVPGDIVLLQSGDKVPADLRLIKLKGLQIQEAALTGESLSVNKEVDEVAEQSVLGDRHNMAFSGTIVTHGQGTGIVIATGMDTQIGHISALVANVDTVTTPLLRQMAQFGRWLTLGILVIAAINFAFGVLVHDYLMSDMFLASVSLAVAAIPEGLPAIMTITLAIGVQRMAKRNAIIRKLPAVETLGAVSVICSDKTGTLTRNEMTVRTIACSHHSFVLTGAGYNPHGAIHLAASSTDTEQLASADTSLTDQEEVQISQHPMLEEALRAAALCNDSSLSQESKKENSEWCVTGDPMEGALLTAGLKAGLDLAFEAKAFPRTDLIPFESEHKFMATLHHTHHSQAFVYLKGAPEKLLDMCSFQLTPDGKQAIDKTYWLKRIEALAQQGQRVLAIAVKSVKHEQVELDFSDVNEGMVMLALFGLIDPPREEAIHAVARCIHAGIRVKMITGDHGITALAIAKQLKLINSDKVLTGTEIDSLNDSELSHQVLDVDVFARVSPEHKLRLVSLLQEQGLIVAMTGDGVNDAPALKRADVGTAMGKNGTEAAKEAAEMVLADDNFASISHAVEQGRTVYDNIKKAIIFILPTNGGEALIVLAAVLLGFEHLPMTPVQILWVNMITAVTLALALAFEPSEKTVMQRPPRDAHAPLLSGYLLWRIGFVSLILMVGTFGLFLWEQAQGSSLALARTVAVNTLVMFEIFYLFSARYISAPVLNWRGLTGNYIVLYAIAILLSFQMLFTYLPPMQTLFGTANVTLETWLRIILVSSSVLFIVESEKYLIRRFASKKWQKRHLT
jgi:magnesium-transporting ATPase (P-type)